MFKEVKVEEVVFVMKVLVRMNFIFMFLEIGLYYEMNLELVCCKV